MRIAWIMAAVVSCFIASAQAAVQPDGSTDDARARGLATQLGSVDQSNADRATGEIQTLFESDPDTSVAFARKYWIPSLISASRFEQAERLALDGILAAPWQTSAVEFLQETRVRMMLRLNRPVDALSNAHSLFDVATLRGTERAILLIVECIKAVHGGDNAILLQLRKEELAGATTRPAAQIEPTSRLMAQIPIDPSPYAAAIGQYVSDDDQSRRAKGNLLLLAGRCDEAVTTFETMKRLSGSGDRMGLAENVARAMRASDGTIGRANGYMLSDASNHKQD